MKHSSKSYIAHLARGNDYRMIGSESRGEDTVGNTSDAQFAGMHSAFAILVGNVPTVVPDPGSEIVGRKQALVRLQQIPAAFKRRASNSAMNCSPANPIDRFLLSICR